MARQASTKPAAKPDNDQTLNGSNTLPALIEIAEGKTVQLGEIVMATQKASSLSVEAWNALPEGERDVLLSKTVEDMRAASQAEAKERAEAEEKAEADLLAAAAKVSTIPTLPPATALEFTHGAIARQEVRYRGKTYSPGEALPTDIDADAIVDLRRLGAI